MSAADYVGFHPDLHVIGLEKIAQPLLNFPHQVLSKCVVDTNFLQSM